MTFFLKTGPLAVMLALAATPAFAHATLETPQALVGASYKAVLRVSHGCGSSPTIRVRVRIPEGFVGVKPMPKAQHPNAAEYFARDLKCLVKFFRMKMKYDPPAHLTPVFAVSKKKHT
jgi:hypothetical protein